MKNVSIKVHGQVQGVFFRNSSRKKAYELGVFGFVRNEPDNTVYLEVEGEEHAVDAFLAWIMQGGPPSAGVTSVDINNGEMKEYKEFSIR